MTLAPWVWQAIIYIVGIGAILTRHWLLSLISDSTEENVDNCQHTTEAIRERRFRKGCMIVHPEKGED